MQQCQPLIQCTSFIARVGIGFQHIVTCNEKSILLSHKFVYDFLFRLGIFYTGQQGISNALKLVFKCF